MVAGIAPAFHAFGAEPPTSLRTIYRSFNEDDEILAARLSLPPEARVIDWDAPVSAGTQALIAELEAMAGA